MSTLRNLLVPVYFDETSGAAVEYAAYFARRHGARIHLLHVVPTDELHLLRPLYKPEESGGADEDHADAVARRGLQKIASTLLPEFTVNILTNHDADPVRGILTVEEHCNADLVILSTQARTGISRLIQRNVAERVARESRRPVLVTQRKVSVPREQPFRTILCPIDLDGQHMQSIDHARGLAEDSDGGVRLLHVIPTSEMFLSRPVYGQEPGNEGNFVRAEHCARLAMSEIAKERLAGVRHEIDVHVSPDPVKTILDVERDIRADVMVMVTQGLTGLIHLIVGSVTERVIRKAYCPVLSVHA